QGRIRGECEYALFDWADIGGAGRETAAVVHLEREGNDDVVVTVDQEEPVERGGIIRAIIANHVANLAFDPIDNGLDRRLTIVVARNIEGGHSAAPAQAQAENDQSATQVTYTSPHVLPPRRKVKKVSSEKNSISPVPRISQPPNAGSCRARAHAGDNPLG